tara:strand:- start:1639 stop:1842 length:204 start_codon:yes stop_codon:yes gene_type:complete
MDIKRKANTMAEQMYQSYKNYTKEWGEEYAKELERREGVKYEKRDDPKHPYCTNWPVRENNLTKDEK